MRRTLRGDQRGAHAVEYLMVAGMVAMAGLGGFRFYANMVREKAEQQGRCVAALSCDEQQGPYALVEMGASAPAAPVAGKVMSAIGEVAHAGLMKLSALSTAPIAYAGELERPPLLPAPEGGLDKNRFGVVLNDDPNLLPTGAQLAALGVTSARITLNQGNFTESDQNLAAWRSKLEDYRANKIDVVINMPREFAADFPDQPPGWQWHNGVEMPKDWTEKFTAWKDGVFMRRLDVAVTQLGPYAHGFEVWNEPDELNNRPTYAPALPADEYGKLLRDAYNKIQAGPNGPGGGKPLVITAGLDSGQPPYLTKAAEATGNVLHADAVGLHPYAKHPHLPEDDQNSLEKILGEYTGAKFTTPNSQGETTLPVYVTEASQPSPDHQDVLTYTNNAAVVAGTTPGVAKTYFFWNKTSDDHPGLVEYPGAEPGQPRPPGVTTPGYQQLAGLLGQPCAPSCTIP